MNDWALVTGASAGIGRELTRVLAGHGWNLVLVARNEPRLRELAEELQVTHKIQTAVIPSDLARAGAAADIFAAVANKTVSVLVNNAGFGSYGDFAATGLRLQMDMMQVNMTALVELTHLFLRPMLARHSGRILNVASTAAFQPGPTVNVYYASKAFVYSFTYALAVELVGSGVTATALCPGLTRTEFFERAHLPVRTAWAMDARKVAEIGYAGMVKGKRVVIPGALNKIMSFLAKRTLPALTAQIVRRLHAPHDETK